MFVGNTICHCAQPIENEPTHCPSISRFHKWVVLYKYKGSPSIGVLSGTGRVLHSIIRHPSSEQTRHTHRIQRNRKHFCPLCSANILQCGSSRLRSWGHLYTWSLLCGPLEMTLFSGFSFWSFLPHGSYGSWALCPCESSLLLSPVSDVGLMFAVPSGSSL